MNEKLMYLDTLETPPAVQHLVSRMKGQFGQRSVPGLKHLEDELKLSYYFGGFDVACMRTDRGYALVASAPAGTGVVRKALDELPEDILAKVTVIYPEPWSEVSSSDPESARK